MRRYHLHKRQFLIGNISKKINEDWEAIAIGESLYLSHCPMLSVGRIKDLNGVEWYLLNTAIQTDKEKVDPVDELRNSFTVDVTERYKSWTGRWILIGNDEIHVDCCGLLGCFYTKINEDIWISSSLAILQEVGFFSPRPETLKYEAAIEWYFLPTTRFEGVCKILPSQILNLRTFHLKQRPLPKPIRGLSYNELLEKISEKLKFSLLNVSNSGKRIFMALTGGYDSRLVLAAARYAGIAVETFTRVDQQTSYGDISLPCKLSRASGYLHTNIEKSGFSKEKEELFDCHIGGNIDHIVRSRFSYGQYDSFKRDDLILSGGIFEVARCYYWKKMEANMSVEAIIKAMKLEYNLESYHVKALTKWVQWVKQTPTEGLDWRDRFYLEQRVAGWLSSLQQALDITDIESVHILNCHDLISLFLSIPVEKRRTSEHHRDLIEKMFPYLLNYPFNPPAPNYIRIERKVIRMFKVLFSYI